ncbi:MAG: element excision factor XisI family protein [Bacteroidota bacterium]
MDRVTTYKQIIHDELAERAARKVSYSEDMSNRLIVNQERTEFILIRLGWFRERYRYVTLFHIEIRENKIWLHQNNTDVVIEDILTRKGVQADDIVVAFVHPMERAQENVALA